MTVRLNPALEKLLRERRVACDRGRVKQLFVPLRSLLARRMCATSFVVFFCVVGALHHGGALVGRHVGRSGDERRSSSSSTATRRRSSPPIRRVGRCEHDDDGVVLFLDGPVQGRPPVPVRNRRTDASAPSARSAATTPAWPKHAAYSSAVAPWAPDLASRLHPAASSARTHPRRPRSAPRSSGVLPPGAPLRASVRAPACSSACAAAAWP